MKTPRIIAATLSVGLAFALTLGVTAPANAATAPTPLSVLPSQIVSGTTPTTGGALADAQAVRMAQVWKFVTSPDVVAALKSQQAGTATKTETDLIADAAKKVRIPTGLGTLAKGAGAVGVAYTGYTVGTSVGATAAGAITTELWGVDAKGLVCSATSSPTGTALLSFFSGQNCEPFAPTDGQPINTDVLAGKTFTMQYTSDKGTLTLSGISVGRVGGTGVPAVSVCFSGAPTASDAALLNSVWMLGEYSFSPGTRSFAISRPYQGDSGACSAGTYAYSRIYEAYGETDQKGQQYRDQYRDALSLKCLAPYGTEKCAPGAEYTEGEQVADPVRTVSCDIKASDGQAYTASGSPFKESEKDWSAAVPPCATLPPEVLPLTTSLVLHTDGAPDQVLWTQDLPKETAEGLSGAYKTCLTTVCQLILKKNGVSCFDGADCTGWSTDPNREGTYTCEYAGKGVALSECVVYSPTWEPDALRTGQVYGDPLTGKPGYNSPDKTEQAAAPIRGTDVEAMTPTIPDDRGECFPSGWGLINPVEWVVKPLKCAFAPRQSVVTETFAKIDTATKNSPAGQLQGMVAGWSFQAPSGCSGFVISMPLLAPPFTVADACPGSMLAPIAKWSNIFGILGTAVAGLMSIRASIAGVAAFRGE